MKPCIADRPGALKRLMDATYMCPMSGCWHFVLGWNQDGYGALLLGGRAGVLIRASRLSWMLHVGDIPDGMNVLHRCDVRCCVNPAHLFLGTQLDNILDMHAKGRFRPSTHRGEKHYAATLTADEVRQIRSEYASGDRQVDIASRRGMSKKWVHKIIKGQIWASV